MWRPCIKSQRSWHWNGLNDSIGCEKSAIFRHCNATVQNTVLLYNGPLLCGFNVPIKGLSAPTRVSRLFTVFFSQQQLESTQRAQTSAKAKLSHGKFVTPEETRGTVVGGCWPQTNFTARIVFHGGTYCLLVWPWNTRLGHGGWRHGTEYIRLSISEACPFLARDQSSVSFAVTRVLMKIFRTRSRDVTAQCLVWYVAR